MTTSPATYQPHPISPCALEWSEIKGRTICVNRSAAHRFLGHQTSLRPLLEDA
jgi:hypothetical protein